MRALAVAAIFALGCACSKKPEGAPVVPAPPRGAAEALPADADRTLPEAHPAPEGPGARGSLTANGSTRAVLFKGWSLVVSVHLDASQTAPSIEVRDASGAVVVWPFAGPTGSERVFSWMLSAVQTAALAGGAYRLRADSDEIVVTVEDFPATPTEEQKRALFLSKAGDLLSAGKAEEVAALARDEQARAPKDPNPWMLEGDALRRLDRPADAAARYRRALDLFKQAHPKSSEPPVFLHRRMSEVEPSPFEK